MRKNKEAALAKAQAGGGDAAAADATVKKWATPGVPNTPAPAVSASSVPLTTANKAAPFSPAQLRPAATTTPAAAATSAPVVSNKAITRPVNPTTVAAVQPTPVVEPVHVPATVPAIPVVEASGVNDEDRLVVPSLTLLYTATRTIYEVYVTIIYTNYKCIYTHRLYTPICRHQHVCY